MKIIITKFNLLLALAHGGPLSEQGLKTVNAVEREDGSNHKWNVTGIDTAGNRKTVFVHTID